MEETALAKIDRAKLALAEATTLNEVLDIRDKAAAMVVYAEAKGAGEAAQIAKELQLRAERKAGAFIAQMPKNPGGQREQESYRSHRVTGSPPSLADLGVEKMQSSRWQSIADIPEEVFEEAIESAKAKSTELTQTALLK
jgi:uncharacterized protein YceH (UPF0502 family)